MLHDETHKRLFASKLMVEHLLRACLPDDLLAAADFSELGELSTALLCRMAAARFGADTAARLTDVLAPITDPDRLAEIGDWLVRCDIGAEFLARLDRSSPS